MNIEERIQPLRPYVIQIRFLDGAAVVDTVLKGGWKVPNNETIKTLKGEDENVNYYMFYSETPGIGLDKILDHIELVINMNVEMEMKYELLKVKTEELKNLFKQNNLADLEKLKFVFGRKDLIPDEMPDEFNGIDVGDIDDIIQEEPIPEPPKQEVSKAPQPKEEVTIPPRTTRVQNQDIELPPRGEKITLDNFDEPQGVCKCVGDEVCPICIDEKENAY